MYGSDHAADCAALVCGEFSRPITCLVIVGATEPIPARTTEVRRGAAGDKVLREVAGAEAEDTVIYTRQDNRWVRHKLAQRLERDVAE